MFSRVFLGYSDGTRLPTAHGGGPLYGNLLSETVHGMLVLHLWPYDFPLNARTGESQPVASLWRPQVSAALQIGFAVSGLECQQVRGKSRWLAQRWMVEPVTFADIKAALEAVPRFGQNTPTRRASSDQPG